ALDEEIQVGHAAKLDGQWGADNAVMSGDHGTARIKLRCGNASIDEVTFTSARSFTAKGTVTFGSGFFHRPGTGPQPTAATFEGRLSGSKLTLRMTADGESETFKFTKDRPILLNRCR